jgi:hypothetical protein
MNCNASAQILRYAYAFHSRHTFQDALTPFHELRQSTSLSVSKENFIS